MATDFIVPTYVLLCEVMSDVTVSLVAELKGVNESPFHRGIMVGDLSRFSQGLVRAFDKHFRSCKSKRAQNLL